MTAAPAITKPTSDKRSRTECDKTWRRVRKQVAVGHVEHWTQHNDRCRENQHGIMINKISSIYIWDDCSRAIHQNSSFKNCHSAIYISFVTLRCIWTTFFLKWKKVHRMTNLVRSAVCDGHGLSSRLIPRFILEAGWWFLGSIWNWRFLSFVSHPYLPTRTYYACRITLQLQVLRTMRLMAVADHPWGQLTAVLGDQSGNSLLRSLGTGCRIVHFIIL